MATQTLENDPAAPDRHPDDPAPGRSDRLPRLRRPRLRLPGLRRPRTAPHTATSHTAASHTAAAPDAATPTAGPQARRSTGRRLVRRHSARAAWLWVALAWVCATLLVLPASRPAVAGFAQTGVLLVVGFVVTPTRTLRWRAIAGTFTAGGLIAAATATGLLLLVPGPGSTAVEVIGAGPGQQSLALLPALLVALVAPRRAARLAAADWVLLGLASGLGFQAVVRLAEGLAHGGAPDTMQAASVAGAGFAGTAAVTGVLGLAVATWRRARTATGLRRALTRGGCLVAPVLIWWAVGSLPVLGLDPQTAAGLPQPWRLGGELLGSLLPGSMTGSMTGSAIAALSAAVVLLLALLVDARRLLAADEARSNLSTLPVPWSAAERTRAWTDRFAPEPVRPVRRSITADSPQVRPGPTDRPSQARAGGDPTPVSSRAGDPGSTASGGTPVATRAVPRFRPSPVSAPAGPSSPLAPPPRLTGPIPIESRPNPVETGSIRVDTAAGSPRSPRPDPPESSAAPSRPARIRAAATHAAAVTGRLAALGLHSLALSVCALLAFAIRDKRVILAAHAGVSGQARVMRLVRGRAAAEMTRHARQDALDKQTGPDSRARVVLWRVTAVLVLLLVAGALWLGLRGLPAGGTGPLWLTGSLAGLWLWWTGLGIREQVLAGGAGPALAAVSTGSLGALHAVSGAASYLTHHGHGSATYLRDRRAAVGRYLRTVTPAGLLADAAQLPLTSVPVTLGGAVQARQVRSTAENYLQAFDLDGIAGYLTKAETFVEFTASIIPTTGHHDVVVQIDHGSAATGFTPRTLARLILDDADYNGAPIRLIPGAVGGAPARAAQELADRLGVEVLAPNDTVFVFDSGRMVVGPSPLMPTGAWVTYSPGAKP